MIGQSDVSDPVFKTIFGSASRSRLGHVSLVRERESLYRVGQEPYLSSHEGHLSPSHILKLELEYCTASSYYEYSRGRVPCD